MLVLLRRLVLLCTCTFTPLLRADFLPPNDLHLRPLTPQAASMTEAEFLAIMEKAEDYYAPLIRNEHGGNLVIRPNWRSRTVNASASRMGRTWYVNMYGGLARHEWMDADGLALVVCHEIGHHLAGYPVKGGWAANEGQSDYFAAQSCARRLWEGEEEVNARFRRTAHRTVRQKCDEAWWDEPDQDLCYRIATAARGLAAIATKDGRVSYDDPDPGIVSRTDHSHPAGQCRLDTMVAGALCTVEFDVNLIPRSRRIADQNACARATGFSSGVRPRCWYKP